MADNKAAVRHQTLIGGGVLLLGVLMAAGAWSIPSAAGYAGVGPNFLPWLVAVGLIGVVGAGVHGDRPFHLGDRGEAEERDIGVALSGRGRRLVPHEAVPVEGLAATPRPLEGERGAVVRVDERREGLLYRCKPH